MKRILFAVSLLVALAFALEVNAAPKSVFGRITSYNVTSVSVLDKEVVTFGLDERTTYTKLVTQKPWQESTRLDAGALATGRLVIVHARGNDPHVADWVEIATDRR